MFDTNIDLMRKLIPSKNVFAYNGYSMYPTFLHGDLLIVSKKEIASIEKNDIIAYLDSNGNRIAHRVITPIQNGWFCRGDNTETSGMEKVLSSQIIGVVTNFYRNGRLHDNHQFFSRHLICRYLTQLRFYVCTLMDFFLHITISRIPYLKRFLIKSAFFETSTGPVIKFFAFNQTIGRVWMNDKQIETRRGIGRQLYKNFRGFDYIPFHR